MLRPTALLATALSLFLGCGGKVVIDQGAGGDTGDTGAGGQGNGSVSANASTGTGTSGACDGIQNDCCSTAIDATNGGTFGGTTCGADTTFKSTGQCGPSGAPDAFYFVNPEGGFYPYKIEITPGFYIMATTLGATCDAPSACPFEGSFGSLYVDSLTFIAVQRQDGQCGDFKITFQLSK